MEPTNQNYTTDQGEIRRWVVITQDILGDKEINAQDKILLAYISSFERYYASNASAAEFLGLSERIVERSKQKLTRLGYIKIMANTGRGNVYAIDLERFAKIGESDAPKLANQTSQKWRTENKEESKKKNLKRDESAADDAQDIKKAEYGREDINGLIEQWQAETGINIKGQQNQRRQLYNLLRKYGPDGTKALINRVGAAIRSGDRFAPQIATPSELTGKYSKLPRLELWENRNTTARPFGQGRGFEDDRPLPSYIAVNGFADLPPAHEYSDEERARVSQMFKEARKTLPFMQKKGGQK